MHPNQQGGPAAIPAVLSSTDGETINQLQKLFGAALDVRDIEGTKHVVVPMGWTHFDLTEKVRSAQAAPHRSKGDVQLGDLTSFVSFCKLLGAGKDWPHARVYASPKNRTLACFFNDHGATQPGWRDFAARYTVALSREFNTWISQNGKPLEQTAFAEFVEENHADIVEPSGDVLMRIATTLQAKTDVEFRSSKRLDNGQVQLTYVETIDARAGDGSLEIPREFAIGVRLFENGEGYKVKARLKYRLHAGAVKFWFELDRPEKAIEDAFATYITAAAEIGVPVLLTT